MVILGLGNPCIGKIGALRVGQGTLPVDVHESSELGGLSYLRRPTKRHHYHLDGCHKPRPTQNTRSCCAGGSAALILWRVLIWAATGIKVWCIHCNNTTSDDAVAILDLLLSRASLHCFEASSIFNCLNLISSLAVVSYTPSCILSGQSVSDECAWFWF